MQQRDIVEAIASGASEYHWVEIESGPVVFRVFADALKVNGVRVPVSWNTTVEATKLLGLHPTTALIEDLIFKNASVKIPPFTFNPSQYDIKSWDTVLAFNAKIDKAIEGSSKDQLVATVGKSWIITKQGGPVNYGFHGGIYHGVSHGMKVWQPPGRRHNADHYDYSQTLRLVHPDVTVSGEGMSFQELLANKRLYKYVTLVGPYNKEGMTWT